MARRERDYSAAGPARIFEGFDPSTPVAGFYRMRMRSGSVMVGLRIWHGPPHDPVTDEEMDRSWRWQAEANGEYIEIDRVWPQCAADSITEEQYHEYVRRQAWARANAPETAHAKPWRKSNPLTDPLPF